MKYDQAIGSMTPEDQLSAYGYLFSSPDPDNPIDPGPPPPRDYLDYRKMSLKQIMDCTPQERHWLDQQAAADLAPFLESTRKAPEALPKKYKSKRRASRVTDLKATVRLKVTDPDLSRWLSLRDGAPFIEYLVKLLRSTRQVDLIDDVKPQAEFKLRLHEEDLTFLKNELGGPTDFVKILKEISTYGRYTVTGKERETKK